MGDHLCTDKYSTCVVCGIAVSTDKGDGDESMPISATLQIVCGVTAYTNLSSVSEIAISRHGITPVIYPFVCLHHRRLCYSIRSSPASYPRVHGQMLPCNTHAEPSPFSRTYAAYRRVDKLPDAPGIHQWRSLSRRWHLHAAQALSILASRPSIQNTAWQHL
jgi:hypothetical protein